MIRTAYSLGLSEIYTHTSMSYNHIIRQFYCIFEPINMLKYADMGLGVTDKPTKKTNTRMRSLVGEGIQAATLRVSPDEREILYRNATESFRSINTQVIHTLKGFLRQPVTGSRLAGVKNYSSSNKTELSCSFPLRLPVDLYETLRKESEQSGCTLNSIMRYALYQHPVS